MKFLPYEDVPLFLAVEGQPGEYIFAENATLSVNQPLAAARQLDDNILNICSYGQGSSMSYMAQNFVTNQATLVTLGPLNGPPKPLATSIHSIPKDTEIKFPNGKHLYFEKEYKPNGNNFVVSLYAKSGNWNLTKNEAQSGVFDPIYKYVSSGPIEGSLDVNFYTNTGNLQSFFNITGLSNPSQYPPIDEEKIFGHLGDFKFSNAYLTELSFSLLPNSISQASAKFNIYGELEYDPQLTSDYYSQDIYQQQSVGHGQTSEILGANQAGIDHPIAFNYSISVNRTPRFESPRSNSADTVGLVPTRVSKKSTNISMSINGEHLDPAMLSDGYNGKRCNINVSVKDLNYNGATDNSNGLIQAFQCSGVITSQSLNVGSDGYLEGSVAIAQELK